MMKYPKIDLHTHTTFCDGKDPAETLVLTAIGKGMKAIGFSGHSYTTVEPDCCMSPEQTVEYRREAARLRETYRGKIAVYCGIEQDFYGEERPVGYDYVIGSVHDTFYDGAYLTIDDTVEIVLRDVREHCGGDFYRWVRCYYETVAQLPQKTGCDVIGHLDLVQKFNQDDRLFSSSDVRYRKALLETVDALLERDCIFEINTGAVARGYRREPYPASYALRRIAEKRGRVILSSDAHRRENLMFGFEDAVHYAASCGIGGITVLTENGFVTEPIGRSIYS